MAKVYPPISVIEKQRVQPTEGEWVLLRFLDNNYGDDYEVFFQPFLNEARPDIVVMRKGGGVVIFEVKDWDLANYRSDQHGNWIVVKTGGRMSNTPIRQVYSYKEKLFSLNSEALLTQRTIEGKSKIWAVVNCAVFFHKSSKEKAIALCYPSCITKRNESFLRYIELLGDDSLTKRQIDGFFDRTFISRKSIFFTDDIYFDLLRLFKPDFHTLEQGIEYEMSEAQRILSESAAGARKRIKGVAGAGKSFVLARKAINAYKRTEAPVLILTFNITLKNYIHDLISEVRENFDWRYFHIENYHQLFNSMLDECNLSLMDIARKLWPRKYGYNEQDADGVERVQFSEEELEAMYADFSAFQGQKSNITKYSAILIDEAQDYREEWVRIIMEYVADDNAEIVAFADEKQNVYERDLDENLFPVIPIARGPWDKSLNSTYRLNTEIAELAVDYQKYYFSKTYSLDAKIASARQLELLLGRAHIEYHYLGAELDTQIMETLVDFIRKVIKKQNLHSNDVSVLSSNIAMIRELSYLYKEHFNEDVNCMFESKEEFEKISNIQDKGKRDSAVKTIRRFRKVNFWQNRGGVSFSSIHSFKGLESPAIILIIGVNDFHETSNCNEAMLSTSSRELVYVGITRARNFLYVINVGDQNYNSFFNSDLAKEHISNVITSRKSEFEDTRLANALEYAFENKAYQ